MSSSEVILLGELFKENPKRELHIYQRWNLEVISHQDGLFNMYKTLAIFKLIGKELEIDVDSIIVETHLQFISDPKFVFDLSVKDTQTVIVVEPD